MHRLRLDFPLVFFVHNDNSLNNVMNNKNNHNLKNINNVENNINLIHIGISQHVMLLHYCKKHE